MNISLADNRVRFDGASGSLLVPDQDDLSRRLAMLIEGQCELGPSVAAQKYGFTRQRYFQILNAYAHEGAQGLLLHNPGPKSDYRRTEQIVRLVIRSRFLDSEASAAVIAQKLRQQDHVISQRSIERIIGDYGLQKKTLQA
jgi:hypothetical protein